MTDTQRLGLVFVLAPVVVFVTAIVLVNVAAAIRRLWAGAGRPEATRTARGG